MQRRATSKKRTAEVEKEINMDDKEATPVEDIEEILHPAEPTKPAQQEKQLEKPTQTGDANFIEMMEKMMEDNKEFKGELNKNNE